MAFSTDGLLEAVVKLEPVQRMKVCINTAMKYGVLVGATTFVSGILGGPMGLTIGGVVSSCVAGYMSKDNLQSVPHILCNETTPDQKQKITQAICGLIKSKHINTIRDFILALKDNRQLEEALIQILVMFLTSEMGLKVQI